MRKPLLDVVFKSEKRKGVLLLLQDGAKEMEYLLKFIDTNRQALLPQIRILEEHYLIDHYDDTYELTTIGKLIVDEMTPLLGIIETFDVDIDYWGTHSLNFIPPHLLERINELGKCAVVSPSITEIHEAHKIIETASKKYHYAITTFFYPNFRDIFSGILSEGADMHVIISQSLFDKLEIDNYNDIKELLSNDLVHFYLYPNKMNLLSFVYSEQMVMIGLLTINGSFDNKHVVCENLTAINWAKDVFDYYLKNSTPITEI
ncbi:MAG: winged helix-turn-helix domain-containing protein [Methanolobus sp.]|uniref:helix-turn-helix transcriptional regulator n=1 Tax=Methanolobus sp. TaxID=1874737 RepID=UPI0027318075|nr:winged helix-turn-helix domain-containing protein [Methanolobus sp.]MDP2218337.1 winged helix-turn-helix domain-containing protein [Methanolobus sp.]